MCSSVINEFMKHSHSVNFYLGDCGSDFVEYFKILNETYPGSFSVRRYL